MDQVDAYAFVDFCDFLTRHNVLTYCHSVFFAVGVKEELKNYQITRTLKENQQQNLITVINKLFARVFLSFKTPPHK